MKCISSTTTIRKIKRVAGRLIPFLLCLCMAFPAMAAPASMRVAMVVSEQMQLSPYTVMEKDAVTLLDLVYESLIELDDDGKPQPSLAESWEVLSDGKTWLFTIREGVYFHNGPELTAYDVVASMDTIKAVAADPTRADNEKGLYCLLTEYCTSWEADDARTLRVRTDKPSYSLLYAMTFPVTQAQSARDINPPGTGPYRVSYYVPGQTLWLEANQNWWGQTPRVSEITGVWYENTEEALAAYEAEEVDVLMTRSISAVRYRGTVSSRTNSYDYSTRQLECLVYNTYAGKLSDARMRQAIAYAINRSRLMTTVYQGVATATDTIQHPSSWLYNGSTTVYNYNVELANQLLDELGWNLIDDDGYRYKKTENGNSVLEMRLYYYNESGNTLRKEAAKEISEMLKAVGIKVVITTYGFANAKAKMSSGDFDLCLCAYNFDATPDPYFLLVSGGSGNYALYRSSDAKDLCKKLRETWDETEYQQVWYDIQAKAAEDLPLLPLYWRDGVMLSREAFSSIRTIREYSLLKSVESYK